MVFGLNALITKPAQSLAPMLVVSVLNRYGYKEQVKIAPPANPDEVTMDSPPMLTDAMFMMLCAMPLFIGTIQSIFWTFYKIRSSHTALPKHVET